jgi:hypothetical protein
MIDNEEDAIGQEQVAYMWRHLQGMLYSAGHLWLIMTPDSAQKHPCLPASVATSLQGGAASAPPEPAAASLLLLHPEPSDALRPG